MNVSIATVASDIGTTVTGIQAAITVLGGIALVAVLFTRRLPARQSCAVTPDPPPA